MTLRILAAVAALVALTAPASAHAKLKQTDPTANAVLRQTPKEITLTFSEALEPAMSRVSITDGQGHDMAGAAPVISGPTMKVAVKPLATGRYHVSWHVISVDTHSTVGTFDFTVKP